MQAAQISPFHNFWSDIHDFSSGAKTNWEFTAETGMRWPGILRCQEPKAVSVRAYPSFPNFLAFAFGALYG